MSSLCHDVPSADVCVFTRGVRGSGWGYAATPMSPRTSPSTAVPVPSGLSLDSPSGSFAGAPQTAITGGMAKAPTHCHCTIKDDMLREVDNVPRTQQLLQGWAADPDIQALCERLRGKSAADRQTSLFRLYPWYFQGWDIPLSPLEVVPEDKALLQCRARLTSGAMGLASTQV